MKGYLSELGIEVIITVTTILGGLLSFIITKIVSYKKKIRDQTLDEVKVDSKQDSHIINLAGKVTVLENLMENIKKDIESLKSEQLVKEQRMYAAMDRVEDKLDKVYELILQKNG